MAVARAVVFDAAGVVLVIIRDMVGSEGCRRGQGPRDGGRARFSSTVLTSDLALAGVEAADQGTVAVAVPILTVTDSESPSLLPFLIGDGEEGVLVGERRRCIDCCRLTIGCSRRSVP
jgi:hypothetical protein